LSFHITTVRSPLVLAVRIHNQKSDNFCKEQHDYVEWTRSPEQSVPMCAAQFMIMLLELYTVLCVELSVCVTKLYTVLCVEMSVCVTKLYTVLCGTVWLCNETVYSAVWN
jgi:hypothetical protein